MKGPVVRRSADREAHEEADFTATSGRSLGKALTGAGYHVISASDASQLLQLARKQSPSLILLDVMRLR